MAWFCIDIGPLSTVEVAAVKASMNGMATMFNTTTKECDGC